MTERPLIIITGDIGPAHTDTDRLATPMSYARAIAASGGFPLVLPPLQDLAVAAGLRHTCDGILFTGGADLSAESYGAEPHSQSNPVNPLRQHWDLELMRQALAWDDTPLLAICLGVQELNVALGGTLHQHLPDLHGRSEHRRLGSAEQLHPVTVKTGTRLADIMQNREPVVNSSHHQAIALLGDGLTVVANACDGTIEAVEYPKHPNRFLFGLQWHPERITDFPEQRRIFEAFVQACRRRVGRRQPGSGQTTAPVGNA